MYPADVIYLLFVGGLPLRNMGARPRNVYETIQAGLSLQGWDPNVMLLKVCSLFFFVGESDLGHLFARHGLMTWNSLPDPIEQTFN